MVADYKNEFMLGRQALLLPSAHHRLRQPLSDRLRRENGATFTRRNPLYCLARLSMWWLRLSISIECKRPGCEQQNGCHERMPPTLKLETIKLTGLNLLQQRAKFDKFLDRNNTERPH